MVSFLLFFEPKKQKGYFPFIYQSRFVTENSSIIKREVVKALSSKAESRIKTLNYSDSNPFVVLWRYGRTQSPKQELSSRLWSEEDTSPSETEEPSEKKSIYASGACSLQQVW